MSCEQSKIIGLFADMAHRSWLLISMYFDNRWGFCNKNLKLWIDSKINLKNADLIFDNEVSTRHDMSYGQVWYSTLVDKLINFTKAEPLFSNWSKKVTNDHKINLAP